MTAADYIEYTEANSEGVSGSLVRADLDVLSRIGQTMHLTANTIAHECRRLNFVNGRPTTSLIVERMIEALDDCLEPHALAVVAEVARRGM